MTNLMAGASEDMAREEFNRIKINKSGGTATGRRRKGWKTAGKNSSGTK